MEKQGMAGRFRLRGPGLLRHIKFFAFLALLLFYPAFTGSSQEGGGERDALEISVVSFPDNPAAGGSWTVTILVEHPVLREVTVKPPRFPPSLILERVRTESRSLSRPGRSDEAGPLSGPVRWTAVEFLFTLREPGEIVLEPFEALAGGRSGVTRKISVRVREAPGAPRRQPPVLRWQTPVPAFTVGKASELRLSLTGWERGKEGPRGLFKGKAPLNAILEELSPTGPLESGEFIYPVSIIPLEETVVLEGFSFPWEDLSLAVPSLTIRSKPGEAPSGAPALPPPPSPESALPEPASPESESGEPPFPKTGGRVFPFFRAEYDQTVAEVKALWEEGRRAGALAEIRGKERESWIGPELAALRREMEQSLGLSLTEDESWRPLKMPVLLIPIFGLLLAAAVLLLRSRFSAGFSAVTSGKISGYKLRIIIAAAAVFAVIFLVEFSGTGSGGRAVLEKTPVYRVPEKEGAVSASFDEGQPVRTGVSRGEWVYVESANGKSADGRAGWAPAASVIRY